MFQSMPNYISSIPTSWTVKEQAKYELAMKRIFDRNNISAFTNTFEDLHNMKQLPGLATQRLMAQGVGYGGEGDWKKACMAAVMMKSWRREKRAAQALWRTILMT